MRNYLPKILFSILFIFVFFVFSIHQSEAANTTTGTCPSINDCISLVTTGATTCPANSTPDSTLSCLGVGGNATDVCCVPNSSSGGSSGASSGGASGGSSGSSSSTTPPSSVGLSTTTSASGWVPDPEVNFVGKNAARAGLFLDWALSKSNYGWIYLPTDTTTGQFVQNPLLPFWTTIRNIVYAMLILFVLVTAFILIATRGRSITIKRFIPRFIAIVLLVTFSFSILQILYQIADIIQLFFLQSPTYPGSNISQRDLLYVGWEYASFVGMRLQGDANTESAYISLLMVKLTAITYYVMVGILLLRKIILWFFIILSPIFPLLLLYKPIRNTGKIWIGEFFRWLMYAPLFSVLLAGLVSMWTTSIPLNFTNYSNAYHTSADVTGGNTTTPDSFPFAINIELGAPKQQVDPTHSLSFIETFAEYVVALLMLWVVILLPFILLQIFLDFINSISFGEATWMQQLVARSPSFFKPPPPPSPVSPQPPGKYQPTGLAKSLPYDTAIAIPRYTNEPLRMPSQVNAELLQLTNLSVPTMRDIARLETSRLSSLSSKGTATHSAEKQEDSSMQRSLERIANPQNALHERLQKESQKGNVLAQNILNAATISTRSSTGMQSVIEKNNTTSVQSAIAMIMHPESSPSSIERSDATALRQTIMQESEKGNETAATFVALMNALNKIELTNISHVIEKLADPASIKDSIEQKKFMQLKDTITLESKAGDPVATSLMSAVKMTTTKGVDIATLTQVRETLRQESKKGNKIASDVLSSTDEKAVISQVQSLLHKLTLAKQRGDPIATKILALFAQKGVRNVADTPTKLPLSNRIQTVSIEDYEAVRKMWAENYQKLDIPQSLEGSNKDRQAWISADIDTITQTISLLSSTDQDKVAAGMQQVSGILPFLMLGGFSQSEIIAYLKAKQQAGKEVLEQLVGKDDEEDTTMTLQHKTQVSQSMHMEEHIVPHTSEQPFSTEHVEPQTIPSVQMPRINTDLLSLTHLSVPTMQEIAQYEAGKLVRDYISPVTAQLHTVQTSLIQLSQKNTDDVQRRLQTAQEEGNAVATAILQAAQSVAPRISLTDEQVQDVQKLLLTMTNVSTITNQQDRDLYMKLHEQLVEENQKINPLATTIYQTAEALTQLDNQALQDVMMKLANPEQVPLEQQQHIVQLKAELNKESQTGNAFAASMLQAMDNTTQSQVHRDAYNRMREQLLEEEKNGNPLAQKIVQMIDHTRTLEKIDVFIQEMVAHRAESPLADAILQLEHIALTPSALSSVTTADTSSVMSLLQELVNPNMVADPQRKKSLMDLIAMMLHEKEKKNPIATTIEKMMRYIADTELANLQLAFQHIADPARVKDVHIQEQCKTLRKEIEQEVSAHNAFASALQHAIELSKQSLVPLDVLERLQKQIQDEVKKGNSLAISLISLHLSDTTTKKIAGILEEVLHDAEQKDQLASQLTDVLSQKDIKPIAALSQTVVLPEKNTVQTVSVSEYESSKHIWQDIYEKAELPLGTDRRSWLLEQMQEIDTGINLLSSSDEATRAEGMKQVRDILPFILLGGFSQSEIILYMQAKKQAAKSVFDALEHESQDNVLPSQPTPVRSEEKHEKAQIP